MLACVSWLSILKALSLLLSELAPISRNSLDAALNSLLVDVGSKGGELGKFVLGYMFETPGRRF